MGTPMFYMFREREKIFDLFEMASGQRLMYSYMRPGGLVQDVPAEFLPALHKLLDQLPRFFDEYDQLISQNEIFLARSKGIGVLSAEQASITPHRPVLIASGVKWTAVKAILFNL
jgi:NADH-quinone oxidoreductase subunit D